MVAELVAGSVLVIVLAAESLHARRTRHIARLAFGPTGKPRHWARCAPLARAAATAALAWGLTTLLLLAPKVHRVQTIDKNAMRHLVLALDVSPSMRLEDAGPTKKQARRKRVADLLSSLFDRAGTPFRISVVAFYNGAKQVVVDTTDMEVVGNILDDLPMHFAFEAGETRLFDGLEEAVKLARPWSPKSATLVILSDGDTVPATGMPKLPASISHVLVVGVGDPRVGSFIDGRQSRQDVSTLRQVAVRLGGVYHNGNEKQITTDTLRQVTAQARPGRFERFSRREYALAACAVGGMALAVLPVLLQAFGTSWRPGVRRDARSVVESSREQPAHRREMSAHPAAVSVS